MHLNIKYCTLVTLPTLELPFEWNPVGATKINDFHDLGIQIDSKLKFHKHTDIIVKKAYRVLGLIYKSFECKDADVI